MKNHLVVKIMLLIVLSALLASCTQTPAASVDVAATLNAVQTESASAVKGIQDSALATINAVQSQSVATIGAQVMQTVAALPTATPYPTAQPPAATAVPATAVVIAPTTAPTSLPATSVPATQPVVVYTAVPAEYACRVVSISPASGTQVDPGYDFDGVWVVKNTGTKSWDLTEVDFRYSKGTKFQKYADGFDLAQAVNPGGQITLAVDMAAPQEKGYYTTTWALVKGNTTICRLNLDLTVK